eukprot:TRINITY_DN16410_c0_g1_i1.p1 TRINITY_DN16410_c0_g1~~TRINITY_DN16410_c0_g1_i1.p1  ORF type:complete len:259 (+),score=82.98 TRINITY_DN16410_c0_g1_i1:94-870(+)
MSDGKAHSAAAGGAAKCKRVMSTPAAPRGGEWLQYVYEQQYSRMTPELRERLQQKAEQKRQQVQMSKQCYDMRKRAAKTSAPMKKAMAAMSTPAPPGAPASAAYASAVTGAQQAWRSAECDDCDAGEYGLVALPAGRQLSAAALEQAEDEAMQHEESAAGAQEFAQLLESFRAEPGSDEETEAKFKLYETYLGTVERLRNDTLKLWGEARGQFPEGSARAAAERQVQAIDSAENTGLPDFDVRTGNNTSTPAGGSCTT